MGEVATGGDSESDAIDEIIDFDDEQSEPEDLLVDLRSRCEAARIEVRTRTYEGDPATYTSIAMPSGRDKRWVSATGTRLPRLLVVPFEKYVFLRGYEAICRYDDGSIEVGLRGISGPSGMAVRQLSRLSGGEGDEVEIILPAPDDAGGRPTYRIGAASEAFSALAQGPGVIRRPTLILEGLSLNNHDQAVELLQKYANSLLFQIDMLSGISLMLERERVRRHRPTRKRPEVKPLQYPAVEYDNAPLSLYWYARSAAGMPLLQFLAFYQCIEFYFPTFSKAEARRKIALLLKDPTFRADRDSDVARLLSAISVSRSGGVGDERTQLRATLSECLNAEELRAFFFEDEDRLSFFNGKQRGGVHKIPLANEGADIRNDVADRIYNIRCRIVHTKDSDQHGGEMILPFSDDADFLVFDIELAQFVARKVLIATSSLLS